MAWGIFDTQDDLWIGDDNGPRVFEEEFIAKVAAQVVSDQVLGTDLVDRFQAREIEDREWRKRDEITVKRTTLESLQRIEGRVQ